MVSVISHETVHTTFTQCSARDPSHYPAERYSGGNLQFEGFYLALLVSNTETMQDELQ